MDEINITDVEQDLLLLAQVMQVFDRNKSDPLQAINVLLRTLLVVGKNLNMSERLFRIMLESCGELYSRMGKSNG